MNTIPRMAGLEHLLKERTQEELLEADKKKQERNARIVEVLPFYGRTHKPIVNQYKLRLLGTWYFQSYGVKVALVTSDGQVFLDKNYWNYSRTTSKYLVQFLQEALQADFLQVKQGLKEGFYKLADLNTTKEGN